MPKWVQGYSPDYLTGGAVNLDMSTSVVINRPTLTDWQLVAQNTGIPVSPIFTTVEDAQAALIAMFPDTTFSF